MALQLYPHPDNPQPRLLQQADTLLSQGQILAIPTDSRYALVCRLDDKNASETLRHLQKIDDKHHLTLLCRDLRQLAVYARVDNQQYRLLKATTPGAYTFILQATKEVPRRVSHATRKTIGARIPDHPLVQGLLALHDAPLLGCTLRSQPDGEALIDADDIDQQFGHQLGAVAHSYACPLEPTTVVDLSGDTPALLRHGAGDPARTGLV